MNLKKILISIEQLESKIIDESYLNDEDIEDEDFLYSLENAESFKECVLILKKFNIKHKIKKLPSRGNIILLFRHENANKAIIGSSIDFKYPKIEDSIYDWLSNLGEEYFNYLGEDIDEELNKDFWRNPFPLYHGTRKKNVEDIKEDGLEPALDSRGLTNKNVGSAVFLTTDKSMANSYGDVLITVDTKQMKKDGLKHRVSYEPAASEKIGIEKLAQFIGLKNFYYSSGFHDEETEDTIIMYGDIPAKYLSFE